MAHTKTTQVDMLSEHIGVYKSASPEKKSGLQRRSSCTRHGAAFVLRGASIVIDADLFLIFFNRRYIREMCKFIAIICLNLLLTLL